MMPFKRCEVHAMHQSYPCYVSHVVRHCSLSCKGARRCCHLQRRDKPSHHQAQAGFDLLTCKLTMAFEKSKTIASFAAGGNASANEKDSNTSPTKNRSQSSFVPEMYSRTGASKTRAEYFPARRSWTMPCKSPSRSLCVQSGEEHSMPVQLDGRSRVNKR